MGVVGVLVVHGDGGMIAHPAGGDVGHIAAVVIDDKRQRRLVAGWGHLLAAADEQGHIGDGCAVVVVADDAVEEVAAVVRGHADLHGGFALLDDGFGIAGRLGDG